MRLKWITPRHVAKAMGQGEPRSTRLLAERKFDFVRVVAVRIVDKVDLERIPICPHSRKVAAFSGDDFGGGEVDARRQKCVRALVIQNLVPFRIPEDIVQRDGRWAG